MLVLLLVACQVGAPAEGTAVGNLTVSMSAASGTDVAFTSGAATVTRVDLEGCDGAAESVTIGQEVDLVAAGNVALPDGTWCGLGFAFDGPIRIAGEGAGGTFSLELDVPALQLVGEVPAGAKVLELAAPGWVDAAELGLTEGAEVRVDGESALHDPLADAISRRSAMYADGDGNGHVDDGERSHGAEARCEGGGMDTGMGGGMGRSGM